MDFLLWAARSLHIFSAVVWFGGLAYQAAVAVPAARAEGREFDPLTRHLMSGFLPYMWMCVWTLLVTGVALMLFSPKFVFLRFEDWWSVVLAAKQVVFGAIVFFSFGYARMGRRVEQMLSGSEPGEKVKPFYDQMLFFGKVTIALAIIAVMLTAGLNS